MPEEKDDFRLAYHGIDFALSLWDLNQWLRNEIKHKDREELKEIQDKLHEFLEKYEVSLDMIT